MSDPGVEYVDFEARGAIAELFAMMWDESKRHPEVLVEAGAGTGKSRGICEFVNACCEEWPGARWLLLRKTRKSLTESVLRVLWEEETLGRHHPAMRSSKATASYRESYDYPEGWNEYTQRMGRSHVALGSLENIITHMSTEWDGVVVFECTEAELQDWEYLLTRISRTDGRMPFSVLIGDCNPGPDSHFLLQRAAAGFLHRLYSRHEDNPVLYNADGTLTARGEQYMGILDRLTGHRYKRLKLHQWVSATGQVLDEYDPAVHLVKGELAREGGALVFKAVHSDGERRDYRIGWTMASVDWGFYPDPGTVQVWGFSGDVGILLAEVYQLKRQIDWWADRIAALHAEFDLRVVVCDPSKPENITALNDRLGPMRKRGTPALAQKANNDRDVGLDMLRYALLDPHTGESRLFLWEDALREGVDPDLIEEGRKTCFEAEIGSLVYRQMRDGRTTDEIDDRCADHGYDAARYAMMYKWGRDLTRRDSPSSRPAVGTYAYLSLALRRHKQRGLRGTPVV